MSEAATGGILQEKVFLEISQNSQESTCASLFSNKAAGLRLTASEMGQTKFTLLTKQT